MAITLSGNAYTVMILLPNVCNVKMIQYAKNATLVIICILIYKHVLQIAQMTLLVFIFKIALTFI